jgi:hypothetical protein
MPVWLTESGVQLDDMLEIFDPTGEEGQRAWVLAALQDCDELGNDLCPLWSMFSYADAMNSPHEHGLKAFGLFDDDWKPRPAAYAYAQVAGGLGSFSSLTGDQEASRPEFVLGSASGPSLSHGSSVMHLRTSLALTMARPRSEQPTVVFSGSTESTTGSSIEKAGSIAGKRIGRIHKKRQRERRFRGLWQCQQRSFKERRGRPT